MRYSYKYPNKVREINGRKNGDIIINDEFLAQTHNELLNRLGSPEKTIAVQIEVEAPKEVVWEIAAGSIENFFSHQPVFAGLTRLNSLGSEEGGKYIIHRSINGVIFDRIGEVLVDMELSQYTVSDIEIADPSVSGFFPSLYTVKLEDDPENPDRTIVFISYTMLGVAHPWALGVLAYQANSIKYHAESAANE